MASFWQEVATHPMDVFRRLEGGQRSAVLGVLALALVVSVVAAIMAGRTSWGLLYAGLDEDSAGAVVEQLDREGIPYRLSQGGAAIQVPEDQVHRTRLRLANAGLPANGGVGFEIFDDHQLGITDALFNVNLQRAKAGEVQRAIESMESVRRAKVMVHLPKQSAFIGRRQEHASAGITLALRPGARLNDVNFAAMAHLAAACIGHGIQAKDVTITDSNLNQLFPTESADDPLFSSTYMKKVRELEQHLEAKAESQLAQAIGAGRASVRITAELNLTYKETQSETLDDANKVILRETTSSRKNSSGSSGGDPGEAFGNAQADPSSLDETDETTTENLAGITRGLSIDKGGSLRRISVSLLLDASDESLADTARQEGLANLVKAAVGFQEDRGDTFTVNSHPFVEAEAPPEEASGFAIADLIPLLGYLAEAFTVLIVLMALRKVLKGGSKDKDDDTADAKTAEEDLDVRTRVGRYIQEQPEEAREALVNWLREEATT